MSVQDKKRMRKRSWKENKGITEKIERERMRNVLVRRRGKEKREKKEEKKKLNVAIG